MNRLSIRTLVQPLVAMIVILSPGCSIKENRDHCPSPLSPPPLECLNIDFSRCAFSYPTVHMRLIQGGVPVRDKDFEIDRLHPYDTLLAPKGLYTMICWSSPSTFSDFSNVYAFSSSSPGSVISDNGNRSCNDNRIGNSIGSSIDTLTDLLDLVPCDSLFSLREEIYLKPSTLDISSGGDFFYPGAEGEVNIVRPVLHKQWLTLDIDLSSSRDGLVTLEGKYDGISSLTMSPVEAPLYRTAEIDSNGHARMSVPRQRADSHLLIGTPSMEGKFDLSDALFRNGYSWSMEDLKDVSIRIDEGKTGFSIWVIPWEGDEFAITTQP